MADLAEMSYGTVHGRFVAGVADTADAGSDPDIVPMAGWVVFSATVDSFKVAGASPDPVTVFPRSIQANLDAEGYITINGSRDVTLWATDDPDANPTGWQWKVSFFLTLDGSSVSYSSFFFDLPAGSTIDLTSVAPLSVGSDGVVITQGIQGIPGPVGPSLTNYASTAEVDAQYDKDVGWLVFNTPQTYFGDDGANMYDGDDATVFITTTRVDYDGTSDWESQQVAEVVYSWSRSFWFRSMYSDAGVAQAWSAWENVTPAPFGSGVPDTVRMPLTNGTLQPEGGKVTELIPGTFGLLTQVVVPQLYQAGPETVIINHSGHDLKMGYPVPSTTDILRNGETRFIAYHADATVVRNQFKGDPIYDTTTVDQVTSPETGWLALESPGVEPWSAFTDYFGAQGAVSQYASGYAKVETYITDGEANGNLMGVTDPPSQYCYLNQVATVRFNGVTDVWYRSSNDYGDGSNPYGGPVWSSWSLVGGAELATVPGTNAYSSSMEHGQSVIFETATNRTMYIMPSYSTKIGTTFDVIRTGTGTVTFTASGGGIILKKSGAGSTVNSTPGRVTATLVAQDTWLLTGDI